MKRLKNKTFILLWGILSLFLIIILMLFNINTYNNEYKKIEKKIGMIETNHNKSRPIPNDGELANPRFFDIDVYVVLIDSNGKVNDIINYSSENISNDEIIEIFNNNINKINNKSKNSLFSKYLFFRSNEGNVIIVNNSLVRGYMISNIMQTILLFIIIEIIIIYTSYLLTRWLTKPVIESFDKQKQFIYDASHELKTPISIIIASAETMEENPKEKKWLSNIKEEALRMNKLVIDLLDLSKSEDMKEKEVYSEYDLSKLINKKAISFESLMFENKLSLATNIEKNINFKCNQDRIKELLSILIDNAIKHSEKDSTININLYKDKNNIILEVINKGEEIPVSERNKIFERFYRIDKSRNRNQNRYGLGLSIAKNIIDNHNGSIIVDCKDGYTIFKVSFKQN